MTIHTAKYYSGMLVVAVLTLFNVSVAEAVCSTEGSQPVTVLESTLTGSPVGPSIDVSVEHGLTVRLIASKGTEVDLRSLRIRYSLFDITRRVAKQIGTFKTKMNIASEILPAGKHKVSIRVQDTAGRSSRLTLTLAVGSPAIDTCVAPHDLERRFAPEAKKTGRRSHMSAANFSKEYGDRYRFYSISTYREERTVVS